MTSPDNHHDQYDHTDHHDQDDHKQLLLTYYIPGVALALFMNEAPLRLADLGWVDQPEPAGLWVMGGILLSATLYLLKHRAAKK